MISAGIYTNEDGKDVANAKLTGESKAMKDSLIAEYFSDVEEVRKCLKLLD